MRSRRFKRRRSVTKMRLVDEVMRRLAGVRPRIGVCALNPHAGEEGLFGDEEAHDHSAGRRAGARAQA